MTESAWVIEGAWSSVATPTYTAGREPERGVVPAVAWEAKQPGISRGKSRSLSANPTGEKAAWSEQ